MISTNIPPKYTYDEIKDILTAKSYDVPSAHKRLRWAFGFFTDSLVEVFNHYQLAIKGERTKVLSRFLAGLLVLILLVVVAKVVAEPVQMQWAAPTTYVDGEPLPPEHIQTYTILHNGGIIQTAETSSTFESDPGFQCFFVTVTATNGETSGTGLPGSFVCVDIISSSPPGPPQLVCP